MSQEEFIVPYDRIHRRSGHIAVAYKNYVLVWGGYTEHVQRTSVSPIRTQYFPTDEVWLYDCDTELWERQVTRGESPPKNSGSCAIVFKHNLYIFGGYKIEHEHDLGCNTNGLYRLDLTNFTWEQLHPQGDPKPAPCDKLVGWEYNERLYFFGGFGPVPTFFPSFRHVVDPTTGPDYVRGWNNQLVCYCPVSDTWLWPKSHGHVPDPRAAHAADRVGSRLYLFGGRFGGCRMNDLHCLDLETMTWSGDLNYNTGGEKPAGRSWHSLTFVNPRQAIVYGGLNQSNTILSDCWLLTLPKMLWTELQGPKKPRLWHKAPLTNTRELIILGGYARNIFAHYLGAAKDHAEELIVLNFSPKSLRRLCVDAVLSLRENKNIFSEVATLPLSLRELLRLRMEQDASMRLAQEIYYGNNAS